MFSAFTRATFSESQFPSYTLINALSRVSWRFSASSKMGDQGSKFSVSSWEESVPWLETSLSSLSSYFQNLVEEGCNGGSLRGRR